MANISYTNTKATAQLEMSTEEMSDFIEMAIESGPHNEYSSKHRLLRDIIKIRRQTVEETNNRASHESRHTSDVIVYPTAEKEAS